MKRWESFSTDLDGLTPSSASVCLLGWQSLLTGFQLGDSTTELGLDSTRRNQMTFRLHTTQETCETLSGFFPYL
jgi:hypothetical protein